MNNRLHGNRRQMYRFAPPPVWAPVFTAVAGEQRITAEMVIDVTLAGVRVAFPLAGCPAFSRGDAVLASICAPGLEGCAEIRGRVVFAADGGGRRVVAIAFDEQPDLSDRATADFFKVFNRREDPRETPAAAEVVEALVLDAAGQPDGVIDVQVLNQSAKGIGFVVDGVTDAFMRSCDAVAIALGTPGDNCATRPAHLLHRVNRADDVYYGCALG